MCLYKVFLCVKAPNLVNKNEPACRREIRKNRLVTELVKVRIFVSDALSLSKGRLELAINYTRCCTLVFTILHFQYILYFDNL